MGEIRDLVPNARWVSQIGVRSRPSKTTMYQVALTATATEAGCDVRGEAVEAAVVGKL